MSTQSPLPGEANAHHHHLKITDVINHIVHPHKSTHQHEEEKHVAKQERKGVKTLADGTDPIEEFEPLVQYDAEREKSAADAEGDREARGGRYREGDGLRLSGRNCMIDGPVAKQYVQRVRHLHM